MNEINDIETDMQKDPVTHPDVPNIRNPTEPEGTPDPPPAPDDPYHDPYPVIDPPPAPDAEPDPVQDPRPSFPEPIPGEPTDVVF
jgi:hypothetical protein